MSFKCSRHLLQQTTTTTGQLADQYISKKAAQAANSIQHSNNLIQYINNQHPSRISDELNLPSLFNSKPNISQFALRSLIHSHKMDSQYLTNITNYKPRFYDNSPISIWHRLPIYRRSSVLILLFLGRSGELRVILTRRSRKLSSFSGHACLPGGRADNGLESEWHTARRETEEEIGISASDLILKENFGCTVEQINMLPSYLSRTFLAVRPCVGFLNWSPSKLTSFDEQHLSSIVLNPGESASIYSVPLKDFLQPFPKGERQQECIKQSVSRVKWGGIPWKLRSFLFPVQTPHEVKWLQDIEDLSSEEEDVDTGVQIRDVWGLTANILHDLADITYNGAHTREIGEEELIYAMMGEGGQFSTQKRTEFEMAMLKGDPKVGFGDKLSRATFARLKKLYSSS